MFSLPAELTHNSPRLYANDTADWNVGSPTNESMFRLLLMIFAPFCTAYATARANVNDVVDPLPTTFNGRYVMRPATPVIPVALSIRPASNPATSVPCVSRVASSGNTFDAS